MRQKLHNLRYRMGLRWRRIKLWPVQKWIDLHAWRTCRATYRWFVEDPTRWGRGSYFEPDWSKVHALESEGKHTDAGLIRGMANILDSTESNRYAAGGERHWATVLALQTRNMLQACAMGGFQKFAWETMGKPCMDNEKTQFRVDDVADFAGIRLLRVKRLMDPMEGYDPKADYWKDRKTAHSRVTSLNDHSEWKEMEPLFKGAGQIFILLRFRVWVRRLFERPEEEAPDA